MTTGTNKLKLKPCYMAHFLVLYFLFSASFIHANETMAPELSALTLETLMKSRKSVKESSAKFREEKNVGAFKNNIVMEGSLLYKSPDLLIKHYISPDEIRYETENNTIIIEEYDSTTEQKEKQRVKLDRIPILNAFITALRGVLSGNIEKVKKLFHINFSAKKNTWDISLTPKNKKITKLISTMVISGINEKVLLIAINEKSGDSTVTKILSDDIVRFPSQ